MSLEKVNIQEEAEATMKALDYIIVIDHSGSTNEKSTRMNGSRFDEMRETALSVARESEKYDDDGITVIPFSSNAGKVYDGVTADKVADVFNEFRPGGMTNLHLALIEVEKKARASTKDVLAIVYTDGEATDENAVIAAINDAGKEFGRPKIAFVFVQVGGDSGAKKFLDRLDNELTVDVCATFSEEESEGLSLAQLAYAGRNM